MWDHIFDRDINTPKPCLQSCEIGPVPE
ncbi:hypothetical protein AVEN_123336-1, partial [Araneus ventricosus]